MLNTKGDILTKKIKLNKSMESSAVLEPIDFNCMYQG